MGGWVRSGLGVGVLYPLPKLHSSRVCVGWGGWVGWMDDRHTRGSWQQGVGAVCVCLCGERVALSTPLLPHPAHKARATTQHPKMAGGRPTATTPALHPIIPPAPLPPPWPSRGHNRHQGRPEHPWVRRIGAGRVGGWGFGAWGGVGGGRERQSGLIQRGLGGGHGSIFSRWAARFWHGHASTGLF